MDMDGWIAIVQFALTDPDSIMAGVFYMAVVSSLLDAVDGAFQCLPSRLRVSVRGKRPQINCFDVSPTDSAHHAAPTPRTDECNGDTPNQRVKKRQL